MPRLLDTLPAGLGRVGMVARFRPVHRVHAAILRALCRAAPSVQIGIGSSNKYNEANPFSVDETRAMLSRVLCELPGVAVLAFPDLGDGPRWAAMVRDQMGDLDLFVTANPWVRDLMAEHYPVLHPIHLLTVEERSPLSGSEVRQLMAAGLAWQALVPPEVALYIEEQGLDVRLRREFGEAIMARQNPPFWAR